MRQRLAVLVVVILCAGSVLAQFDPQISHYMYLPTAYNPAAVGEGDMMKVAGMHRMQMIGITNAPMTTYFYFGSPFVIGKTRHGAGVRFMNDQFGLFYTQSVYAQYAYRQKIGNGYLAIGAEFGISNVGFHGDSVNLDKLSNSEYHVTSDPLVPSGDMSGVGFDMSAGVYYSCPTWFAGASYSHVTQPYIEWKSQQTQTENQIGVTLIGTLYVHGGYNWRLKHNKEFVMQPSVLFQSDFHSWDVTLAWMVEYKEKYRWGASYRILSNFGVYLGMDIISGLALGYCYELPTSKLLLESFGSHELYLAYQFNILRPKRNNRYKSVRYL
ncbi:MAG: PorP/SprF family type IX secretion system membrane protein [Paludibacteraceae bacterium]|nr:PorP/SprF family type IX secretion system membrane protein [Paludibacteraceae bacterium]